MTDDLDAICAELERLDAAATPAPWRTRKSTWHEGLDCWYLESDDLSLATLYGPRGNARKSAGVALIILVRTHLRALLAERRRMKAEIERLRAAGAGLANAAYNLSQAASLPEVFRSPLKERYTEWDEAAGGQP